ncbi:hypothetical protein IVB52_35405 [Bradyrhizobium sp. CW11]|nr:hypothetical protein [Bradyrhizobium sp. CW11]
MVDTSCIRALKSKRCREIRAYDPDPFVVRFSVEARVVLDLEYSIPILEPGVWSRLSLTKDIERGAVGWAQHASLRASLKQINDADGKIVEELLYTQEKARTLYSFSAQDKQRLGQKASIRTENRAVYVEVPNDVDEKPAADSSTSGDEVRESHKVQATLARVGAEMGFRIWIPRSDRQKILGQIPASLHASFLTLLPLNYDETTLKTIEQIDVIWLKGRSMARAFEVEHTTAIYSGLLRMADLLALQPNMDIRLHIVAPDDKRERVLREIKRPVFSLLDRGPLYESCSYLSYDGLAEISSIEHLSHMSDSIIEVRGICTG